jgi:hypothetical protein
VDDVAWVNEGEDISQCMQQRLRCARITNEWAKVNAVEFDIGKTETILFSRKSKYQGCKVKVMMRVGENKVENRQHG